jgi:hypothetical protein
VFALVKRISKLEKKAASQVRTDSLEGQSLYQPSEADLAEALVILVKCGAVKEDPGRLPCWNSGSENNEKW